MWESIRPQYILFDMHSWVAGARSRPLKRMQKKTQTIYSSEPCERKAFWAGSGRNAPGGRRGGKPTGRPGSREEETQLLLTSDACAWPGAWPKVKPDSISNWWNLDALHTGGLDDRTEVLLVSAGLCSPGTWCSVATRPKACAKLTLHLRFLTCQTVLDLPRHSSGSPRKEERRQLLESLESFSLATGCSSNLNPVHNLPGPQPPLPLPTSYLWFCSSGFTLCSFVQRSQLSILRAYVRLSPEQPFCIFA